MSDGYQVVVAPDGKRYAVPAKGAKKKKSSGCLSNLICLLAIAAIGGGGYYLYEYTDIFQQLEDLLFGEEDNSPPGIIGQEIRGSNGTDYIGLIFTTPTTVNQQAPYIQAAETWSQILKGNVMPVSGTTGNLPELNVITGNTPQTVCGGSPDPFLSDDNFTFAVDQSFDHMVILMEIAPIDGPSGILGQAKICQSVVNGGTRRPFLGGMKFDSDDTMDFNVAFHEIGHTLGIGTLWDDYGHLQNPQGSNVVTEMNPTFDGPNAMAAYQEVFSLPTLDEVPVEDGFRGGSKVTSIGAGSVDSHWHQTDFGTEVMTYSLGASAFISNVTLQHMLDIGYTVVDGSYAEPAPSSVIASSLRGSAGTVYDLSGDVVYGYGTV